MPNNRILRSIILCIIGIAISSCSTAFYLDKYPDFSKNIIYKKVIRTERKLNQDKKKPDLLLNACKVRTEYTYAFIVEKADRLIESDYQAGKELYQDALNSFEIAINYGKTALEIRYPDLMNHTDINMDYSHFIVEDIPYLYWLAAALGGAISSSRGKSEWVIQLPIVGYLLESALAVDSSWNHGAVHSAMITYAMVRTDLKGKNIEVAVKHYEKVNVLSNSQDLSAHVSYAENVLVNQQNQSEFVHLLNSVINAQDTVIEDLELGNIIARKRARWLLSRKDELFY